MAETRESDPPVRAGTDHLRHIGDEPTMTPIPPSEARQAVTGQGVRYMLLWSTLAIVVAFIVIYFVFFT